MEADGEAAGKNRKNKEEKGDVKDEEQGAKKKGKDGPVTKGKGTERSKQYDDGGDGSEDIKIRCEETFDESPTNLPSRPTSLHVRPPTSRPSSGSIP